ncbi:MAG TPA: hypothetical protein VJJ82_00200 [Candidatus Nanoarchaeia archaeon]|nr:hypothetical protein [Candidatus Nanoarchaeia archaeon]
MLKKIVKIVYFWTILYDAQKIGVWIKKHLLHLFKGKIIFLAAQRNMGLVRS